MRSINKFVIYGERCSGTNYLENAIKTNFNIELRNDFGSKHFFCFNKYDDKFTDDTLFIGIVRNPIYWINSLSRELHHIPNKNKPINNLLFNKFYSVKENSEQIILKDLNYINLKMYENIFELRKLKNMYLMNIAPRKVKNYILINYESLLFNYEYTLNYIKEKFNLVKKYDEYKHIKNYKKMNFNFVKQREMLLTPQIVQTIWNNLNVEQENYLGYFKGDNNNKLKDINNLRFITSD